MLDKYTVQRMDALCIGMLESIDSNHDKFRVLSDTINKLHNFTREGEKWAKDPKIPFSMGSMDERTLEERITDNKSVILLIKKRIACLNMWFDK